MISPKGLVPRDPQREKTCLVFYCTAQRRPSEGITERPPHVARVSRVVRPFVA